MLKLGSVHRVKNMILFGRTSQVIIFVYFLTFVIIFPYFYHNRALTVYFSESKEDAEKNVLRENNERLQAATEYFKRLKPNDTYEYHRRKLSDENLEVVSLMVTTRRDKDFHYPIQVAAEFHKQIVEYPRLKMAFIICNVDSDVNRHKDALFLSNYFPTVVKTKSTNYKEKYEKEKEDYTFCLEKGLELKSKFTLIIEDDSVPRPNSLPFLKYILDNKISNKIYHNELLSNWQNYLAVKLYYPLRWSGFAYEYRKLLELISIGCIGGGLFCACAGILWWYFKIVHYNFLTLYIVAVIGGLYLILVALVTERSNCMELSWVHPAFFRVVPSPGCCTQATLYLNSRIPRLIEYLKSTQCNKDFAVDLAIDAYSRDNRLKMYLIEPNLFRHIGFFSSLTGDMKTDVDEFLFD